MKIELSNQVKNLRFEITRPPYSLPGIYNGQEFLASDSLEIAMGVVSGLIIAVRIGSQPPYGIMFRVDNSELLSKVWIAKGRVDSNGNPVFRQKPVTALSKKQLDFYIDWEVLRKLGFNREKIDNLLDLGLHTVLPVNNTFPRHLTTIGHIGNTISTIRFEESDPLNRLVEIVSELDFNAIVGGTSLNTTGQHVYMDSEKVLIDFGGRNKAVDLFVISEIPEQINLQGGAFHSMIEILENKVRLIRKGINYQRLIDYCKRNNILVVENTT
ncbi:MAG: hypothetical protein QXP66_03720 [Candidatus Aenigmatarchaeota archaeon]